MRHTIVIEIPDEIMIINEAWSDEPAVRNLPGYIEGRVTNEIEGTIMRVAGRSFRPAVVEYHHEQMTEAH